MKNLYQLRSQAVLINELTRALRAIVGSPTLTEITLSDDAQVEALVIADELIRISTSLRDNLVSSGGYRRYC